MSQLESVESVNLIEKSDLSHTAREEINDLSNKLDNQSLEVKDVQGALRLQNKMFEAQTAKMVSFFFAFFFCSFLLFFFTAIILLRFYTFNSWKLRVSKGNQGELRLQNKMFEAQTAKMVSFLFGSFYSFFFDRKLAFAVMNVCFWLFHVLLLFLNLQSHIGFRYFLYSNWNKYFLTFPACF